MLHNVASRVAVRKPAGVSVAEQGRRFEMFMVIVNSVVQ